MPQEGHQPYPYPPEAYPADPYAYGHGHEAYPGYGHDPYAGYGYESYESYPGVAPVAMPPGPEPTQATPPAALTAGASEATLAAAADDDRYAWIFGGTCVRVFGGFCACHFIDSGLPVCLCGCLAVYVTLLPTCPPLPL
jgi:hypothetical protein